MDKRTVVVTGASSGVGLAAAEQFARRGDEVILVGRSPQRLAAAVQRVTAAAGGRTPASYRADFAVLDEVRELAARLREHGRIDVLANNAGGMADGHTVTVDGFESTVQNNHLAPFLLTNLLLDRLAGGRIVNTASDAHKMGRIDPADLVGDPGRFNRWRAYGESKGANILFAQEAGRRRPDILSVSFHPGVVRTNFGSGRLTKLFYRVTPFLTTPEQAGAELVRLATADGLEQGGYYVGGKLARPRTDPATAGPLWDASAKAVGLE